jgi:hypothetical protein
MDFVGTPHRLDGQLLKFGVPVVQVLKCVAAVAELRETLVRMSKKLSV